MVENLNEDRLMELIGAVISDCMNDLNVDIKKMETDTNKAILDYYSALAFFKDKESYFKLTGIDFEYVVRKCIKNKTLLNRALKAYEKSPNDVTPEKYHRVQYKGIKNYLLLHREDNQIFSCLLWYYERAQRYHEEYYDMLKYHSKDVKYIKYLEEKLGQKEYNIRRMKRIIEKLKTENKELRENKK